MRKLFFFIPEKLERSIVIGLFVLFSLTTYSQESQGIGNWNEIAWSSQDAPYYPDNASIVTDSVVIPEGTLVEINDLYIGTTGKLVVSGQLIVHGSVDMANDARFSMKSTAVVVVKGNLSAGNKLKLSVASLLIVQGDFRKKGSTQHGDLDISDGDVYIFGEVDPTWEIDDCDPNNNSGSETGNCDYNTEKEYLEETPYFPPELIDKINCFDLSGISDSTVCLGSTATFRVDQEPNVNYNWQVNRNNTGWVSTGFEGNEYIIKNTIPEMEGNLFRVVATPTDADPTCQMSISREVSLTFYDYTWTGGTSTDWNDVNNWSCPSIPTSFSDVIIPSDIVNFPEIFETETGAAKNMTLEAEANLVVNGSLEITGMISSSGAIDARRGKLIFSGVQEQNITGGVFIEDKVEDLTVRNSGSLRLEGSLLVTGILETETGNLYSNGFLTLISDGNQTALISGSGNGEVQGEVHMQRHLDPAFGYKYFSSPFSNSTVGNFQSFMNLSHPETNFPHFYEYNEARQIGDTIDATGWEKYIDPSASLKVMEGYAINFGSGKTPKLITLSGEVNNGAFTRELSNSEGTHTKGFHLVGNPYPSPIDWNETSGWNKNNIDDAVYFFTASDSDQYSGVYRSYVGGISSVDGEETPDAGSFNIIPSMQGFFVHVSAEASSGSLTINNGARVNNFSQEFHKSPSGPKEIPLIRVKANFKGRKIQDPTVIYFNSRASQDFDSELDALKLMNTNIDVPNFYSLTPAKKELSINALPYSLSKDLLRIPLGVKVERSGDIELMLQKNKGFPLGYEIYLVDLEKQIYRNLTKDNYSFYLKKGTYNSRFQLILSKLPINEEAVIFNQTFSVEIFETGLKVNLNLKAKQGAKLILSNLTGQILETKLGSGKNTVEFSGISSAGVYIISVETDESRVSKKVLIQK